MVREQFIPLELLIHLSPVLPVFLASLISVGETFHNSGRIGPGDLYTLSNFLQYNINPIICNYIDFSSKFLSDQYCPIKGLGISKWVYVFYICHLT